MDYGRDSGHVIQIIGGGSPRGGDDNRDDQPISVDRDASVDPTPYLVNDGRQSQKSGIELPNKEATDLVPEKLLFKTQMCRRFKTGTCPDITNCNYAHNIEELRTPHQNWKEFVVAHEDSSSFLVETQRSYKGRPCKRFYTEKGCPYGDKCTYLHEEQLEPREKTFIVLGTGSSVGYEDGGATRNGGAPPAAPPLAPPPAPTASNSTLKSVNWRTRICHKWEQTGYCPFGSNCAFAHGAAELQRYKGGPVDKEANPNKPGLKPPNVIAASGSSVARSGGFEWLQPATVPKPRRKWKGPDKISRIYGDWIDDIE